MPDPYCPAPMTPQDRPPGPVRWIRHRKETPDVRIDRDAIDVDDVIHPIRGFAFVVDVSRAGAVIGWAYVDDVTPHPTVRAWLAAWGAS